MKGTKGMMCMRDIRGGMRCMRDVKGMRVQGVQELV